jgi:hypothetical protein
VNQDEKKADLDEDSEEEDVETISPMKVNGCVNLH